jgi:RHS repeat-associated protein
MRQRVSRTTSIIVFLLTLVLLTLSGAAVVAAKTDSGASYSRTATTGPMGSGWTHSYYIWFEPDAPDSQVAVHWSDGRADYWMSNGEGGYVMSVPGVYDEIEEGDSTWTLTRTNLDVYVFDADGRLISITDKNSNTTTLGYTNLTYPDFVTEVTDPLDRTLTLAYDANGLLESVTDWTGRDVQYTYTDSLLTQVTDVLDNNIDYVYDGNGYLADIYDQRGLATPTVSNTYDVDGRVLEQRDSNDNLTTFTYPVAGRGENATVMSREVTVEGDSVSRTLETTHPHEERYKRQLAHEDPMGVPVEYGYDGMFNRNEITDRNGNTTQFEYDEYGNVLSAAEADDPSDPNDGGSTEVEYDDSTFTHLPTQETNALGFVTEWMYDSLGNVLIERSWLDTAQTEYVEKSWTYNSFGQRETETDERGNVHEWHYDTNGLLEYEIDREDNYTWYGYDDLWRKIWVTDGRGTSPEDPNYTTYYFYDDASRLIRIERPPVGDPPHNIIQWFGYDEIGYQTWVTDGNGTVPQDPDHTTYSEYDGNSNLIRVTAPLGGIMRYEYDEINRKVKMADANGDLDSLYTRFKYDNGGRLVEKEDPEGNLWSYVYDNQGNLLSETDPSGVTVYNEYDAMNRRVLTYDELGNETNLVYDQLGNLVKKTNANGNERNFVYNGLGRLITVIDADSGVTEYAYDGVGNLAQITDANNNVISIREYDNKNRLTKVIDGLGYYYVYGYDEVDNQVLVADAKQDTTILTYDARKRLTQIDYPDLTQILYDYDDNGNLTDVTDPTGSSDFTYDELNRLISSKDSFNKVVSYGYDAASNRTSLIYPDSNQVSYAYDYANRLTMVTDWALRETHYTYDGLRPETVTYPNGVMETRGYDSAGRLDSLVTKDSGDSTLLSYAWNRDDLGNPISVTETGTLQPTIDPNVLTNYKYDTDNRITTSGEFGILDHEPNSLYMPSMESQYLTTANKTIYTHDENGNLITKTRGAETTSFTYDSEDRLVKQTSSGSMVNHLYDGQGNRIARVENGVPTGFVIDQGKSMSHVLCEIDGTGEITAYYIHGPQLVARIETDSSAHYYHTNEIGSVVALTDENEVVTDRYGYTSYGLLQEQEGTTENPFTFVGALGVMEEVDGLYFMRARFYDPATGRFMGKDPVAGALSNPQELHRYAYVMNNPLIAVDPTGEFWQGIAAGIGAIAGGVGTLVSDVVQMSTGAREWGEFSSAETYLGNIVGGAVAGALITTIGPAGLGVGTTLAGAVGSGIGSAVGSLTTQVAENITGERSGLDLVEIGVSGGIGFATGGLYAYGASKISFPTSFKPKWAGNHSVPWPYATSGASGGQYMALAGNAANLNQVAWDISLNTYGTGLSQTIMGEMSKWLRNSPWNSKTDVQLRGGGVK